MPATILFPGQRTQAILTEILGQLASRGEKANSIHRETGVRGVKPVECGHALRFFSFGTGTSE